tara:strand:- start:5288 stop:5530 length:243 start_codon:yes stop_codon:yes gene_type:complete
MAAGGIELQQFASWRSLFDAVLKRNCHSLSFRFSPNACAGSAAGCATAYAPNKLLRGPSSLPLNIPISVIDWILPSFGRI